MNNFSINEQVKTTSDALNYPNCTGVIVGFSDPWILVRIYGENRHGKCFYPHELINLEPKNNPIYQASVLHNLFYQPKSPCTFLQMSSNCAYTVGEGRILWTKTSWGYVSNQDVAHNIRLGFTARNLLLVVKGDFNEIYFPTTPENFHIDLLNFMWEQNNTFFFDPQFWSPQ